MVFGISKEHELLVHCSRLELTSDERARLDELLECERFSWDVIVRDARWHRVSALVMRHLRSSDRCGQVPSEILDQLKEDYHRNTITNLSLYVELRRIVRALHDEEIPVIVLKGSALAGPVYGEIGLRAMRDIDLLVPKEQADRAFAVVEELGYSSESNVDEQLAMKRSHHHFSQLVGLNKPYIIEIHTHILEP